MINLSYPMWKERTKRKKKDPAEAEFASLSIGLDLAPQFVSAFGQNRICLKPKVEANFAIPVAR